MELFHAQKLEIPFGVQEAQAGEEIMEDILHAFASTWLDLHHYGFPGAVPHLLDVQQVLGVSIVPGPAVHEHSGAAAATIHHDPVVQVWVLGVRGFRVCHSSQVPGKKWELMQGIQLPMGVLVKI